jgi:hypothetical protein
MDRHAAPLESISYNCVADAAAEVDFEVGAGLPSNPE